MLLRGKRAGKPGWTVHGQEARKNPKWVSKDGQILNIERAMIRPACLLQCFQDQ